MSACSVYVYQARVTIFDRIGCAFMSRVIGLTGNIASGKTTVGQMLLDLGAERYIDADKLVHRLYEAETPVVEQIALYFGRAVLQNDGSIDRKTLGALVFADPRALRQLESIVHPAVHQLLKEELAAVSPAGIAIIDAVKLLEGGSVAFCQSTWLVICAEAQQLERLMARNHFTEQEARARLAAQPSLKEKMTRVDEIIDNGGTREETHQQVVAAFLRFCQRFPGGATR